MILELRNYQVLMNEWDIADPVRERERAFSEQVAVLMHLKSPS